MRNPCQSLRHSLHSHPKLFLSSGLFGLVLSSRVLTSGAPYFADAQRILHAARSGAYVIQAPGYWLFIRTAALFPSPEAGLQALNWIFSSLGAVVFFLLASELVEQRTAFLASLAYSFVFFNWFAGDVHSSYASQMLFPPLLFLCLLKHSKTNKQAWLFAGAVCFALGAGFRPSDGTFLIPMVGYYLYRRRNLKETVSFLSVAGGFCLLWFIPQQAALHRVGGIESHVSTQLDSVAFDTSVLTSGLTKYTAANLTRYFLPLAVAFWPLAPFLRWPKDETQKLLWLWFVPGSLFFALVYMSWATYLVFISGAFILLACTRQKRFLSRALLLCLAWNVFVFVGFRPVKRNLFRGTTSGHGLYASGVINVYVGDYTLNAIRTRSSLTLKSYLAGGTR